MGERSISTRAPFQRGTFGDAAADALRRAGDGKDLVLEPHHAAPPCLGGVELLERKDAGSTPSLPKCDAHGIDHRRRAAEVDIAAAAVPGQPPSDDR
jgi:hypothetical protein